MRNRRKLSNFFPEPKFQLKYISLVVGSSLFVAVFTLGILGYFLRQNYIVLVKYASTDPQLTESLMWEFNFLLGVMSLCFLFFLAGLTLISIIFSHRVAGVVFVLKRAFNQVAQGERVVLKFRKHDEFKDLETSFNNMMETLRKTTFRNAG